MSIRVHVPAPLRNQCAGASELELAADSLHAVFGELRRTHPALYTSICDETGALRRHVNLFVNEERVRDRARLDGELQPGDILTIMPAVSGG